MDLDGLTICSTIDPQREGAAWTGWREGTIFAFPRVSTYVTQTQLPPEYVELEKRVDALKEVHQKLLAVTYA